MSNPPARLTPTWHRAVFTACVALSLGACGRAPKVEAPPVVEAAPVKEDPVQVHLEQTEEALAARSKELAEARKALDTAALELTEKEQIIAKRTEQIAALQKELEAVKKRDTLAFGEARALQRRGGPMVALDAFRKFTQDYPKSPLLPDAEAAILELSAETQRTDADLFGGMTRRENQTLTLLRDGLLTPAEMAPLLRRKSRAQVTQMLGKPNIVFPDGNEIGYNDRGINPTTGRKGMLIVSFQPEGDSVTGLRVDYAGRQITP